MSDFSAAYNDRQMACPQGHDSTGKHRWMERTPKVDESRPIEIDPMIGVMIYTDTDEPVYDFPYTETSATRTICTNCGRVK